MRKFGPAGVLALLLAGAAVAAAPSNAPAHWPSVHSAVRRDPKIEAHIERILKRMSVEEKVGQVIQADISAVTADDVRKYKLGSILAGGNSAPHGDNKAPAADWLKQADDFWNASRAADWRGEKIPLIYGIDAVHGHTNIVGATIFPQNIGLGAMRDPALIERIGRVTAEEMAATGFDWDFSPTLAVVRDDRWGRTYEGFSEDPSVVREYAGKMVEGLQGRAGTKAFLGAGHVIATAKHFVGDGGTAGGKDQGDNPSPPAQLRDIAGAGYPPAIAAGVQAVMASFSSVRGEKVHGDKALLTGALPLPEATAEELVASASAALGRLIIPPAKLTSGLLDHGEGRLERHVRLLCTDIWPTLYHVLAVRDRDPIRMWGLAKPMAIAQLSPATPMGAAIRAFYDALVAYYPSHADAEAGLRVIERGVAFLRAARTWWTSPRR